MTETPQLTDEQRLELLEICNQIGPIIAAAGGEVEVMNILLTVTYRLLAGNYDKLEAVSRAAQLHARVVRAILEEEL